MSLLRIIGIGNPDRGDDAFGPAVIATLAVTPPPTAELTTSRGDMLALIDAWSARDRVILVDAMAPGSCPGRVTRLDASSAITSKLATFTSSHAFNLAETIELARALGRLPSSLVVYGVEGTCFDSGAPLSPAVARAVPEVAARLREECAACTKLH
jgi:hydrogenase maturation protease